MAATTSAADYTGRTVDLAAFQGHELGAEVLLGQSLAGTGVAAGGLVVTGTLKLAQRFLVILLTEQGSLRYLPDAGCGFMTDARLGRWRTPADVRQSFHSALLDVQRQLGQLELPGDPDDERLAGVTVLAVELNPADRAGLRLRLTTRAGTARTFIAPLSVVPR